MAVIKLKVTEQWIAVVRRKHCILQFYTWKMIVQYACVNLEPLELKGLGLCLHDLIETVCKVKKKIASQLVANVRTCPVSCFSVPPHSWIYVNPTCSSAAPTPYSELNPSCC